MADYPPKKGVAFTYYLSMFDSGGAIVNNPPLAAGDFQILVDGVDFTTLDTTPDVFPAASSEVRLQLSVAEMTGDIILVKCSDQTSPKAWQDFTLTIVTAPTQIGELVRSTTPTNTLDVAATGEVGLDFSNIKQAAAPTNLNNITLTDLTTLLGKFTGITLLANWLRGLARKDAMNAAAKLELNAGGGAFDETTDSQEAIADAIVPGAPINIVVDETDIVVNP